MSIARPVADDKQRRIDEYLKRRLAQRPATPAATIPRRPAGRPVPLSFAQQQIWLHAQLAPDVPLYNEPLTVRRTGPLDVAALEAALGELLRRHEAWRTRFPAENGEPMQVVAPPPVVRLPVADLRRLPEAEREPGALNLATRDAIRPFELARGPLFRALLVQLGDEDYRLYVTLHHIIHDGVSLFRLLLPELTALYEAYAAGRAPALPEPVIQYPDFAAWQREELTPKALAGQLDYWKRRIGARPPVLALPTDHPRPAVQTFRGARERIAMPKSLADQLKELSRRENVTLFMTLQAAFAVLLHRYAGQDDLVLGTVTAGRKRPELEKLLGFFANPVALRIDCSGNPAFRELLTRVRDVTLEALANDDVPFELVVSELAPERDPGRNPLFQVVMSLEAQNPDVYPGWELTPLDVDTGTAKFDLYVELADRPQGIVGRCEYSSDLFDAPTMARMIGHYQTLLESIVADPGRRLSELPLLTSAERTLILNDWANTNTPGFVASSGSPRDSQSGSRSARPATRPAVHRLFEAQAAQTPNAAALVFRHEELTYGELNERANRLARHLLLRGVTPGDFVGVCLDRSPDLIVALLAILKTGAAYVPLDPSYPHERLTFMIADARLAALISQETLVGEIDCRALPTVFVDTEADAIAAGSVENLPHDGAPDDVAYVMYTSGSTGQPKGVAIPHRGIVRLVLGQQYATLGPSETLLQLAPISFDASTFEIWGALLHGGRCVLFPGRIPTHKALGETIERHAVTTLWLTASLFNAVIDEAPETLMGVRQILTGGEALSVAHVRRALDVLSGATIINGYGPTETTTFACCHPIPRPLPADALSIPIGRPIANTCVYVLDRDRNPVPAGVPGELYIGGAGVARGYVNRPELTAEKFVPNPFSSEPGDDRLYRTGDLVRFLADGTLDFLGRLDSQVKIRGFRVEPGEVEAAIGQHPAVREVAVVARPEPTGSKVLVAYVATRDGAHVEISQLRTFLRQKLPAHMIPSHVVELAAFPLTPTGKIDRLALPAPGRERAAGGETFVAPRDPLECELARIWQDLLHVDSIGVRDDFFQLGGHSLLAVRMMRDVEEIYGRSVPLATLYASPTIETLAGELLRQERAAFASPFVVVQKGAGRTPLFFFHGDLNGGGFYCLKLARRLGADRPFFAVHPLGLDGRPAPPTVEAMAAAQLETILGVQPRGPYLLGGYCNGGLVAYEIARLLEARGERVEVLVLVAALADTGLRSVRALMRTLLPKLGVDRARCDRAFARLRFFRAAVARQPWWARAPFAIAKIARIGCEIVAPTLFHGESTIEASDALEQAEIDRERPLCSPATYHQYRLASMGYVPQRFGGRVLLFWPSEEPRGAWGDPTMGWGRVAGAVEVHHVACGHTEIVAQRADLIADRLKLHLDALDDRPSALREAV